MADFSTLGGSTVKAEAFGVISGESRHKVVVPSATIHVKGSYVELTASTSFDYRSVKIFMAERDNDINLVDIAVGSAGNEEVIIKDLMVGFSSNLGVFTYESIDIPINIPKGSRISARSQAGSSSANGPRIGGIGFGGSFGNSEALSKVITEGENLSSSEGTIVDPGAVANTKGSWSQLTSSSSKNYAGIFFILHHSRDAAPSGGQFLLDIGIGAASSEQVIIPDYAFSSDVNDIWMNMYCNGFIPISIPEGTRITARAKSSITDATDRKFGIILYGVH